MVARDHYLETARMLDEWSHWIREINLNNSRILGFGSSSSIGRAEYGRIDSGRQKSAFIPFDLDLPEILQPYDFGIRQIWRDPCYRHLRDIIAIRYLGVFDGEEVPPEIHRNAAKSAALLGISRSTWDNRLQELFAATTVFVRHSHQK